MHLQASPLQPDRVGYVCSQMKLIRYAGNHPFGVQFWQPGQKSDPESRTEGQEE